MPSTVFTPEEGFNALDDECFENNSGSIAIDAHMLRSIARSNNYFCLSGHQLFTQVWPVQGVASDDAGVEIIGAFMPNRTMLIDNLPVAKKPFLRYATLKILQRVDTTATVYYGIGTRANPLPDTWRTTSFVPANYIAATGTGDWDTVTLDNIPISPGPFESISIVFWTSGALDAETTGSFGSPLTVPFEFTSWAGFAEGGNFGRPIGITRASSNWSHTLADGEHALMFTDSGGTPVVSGRFPITFVTDDGDSLFFSGHLTPYNISQIINQSGLTSVGTNNGFAKIMRDRRIEIANVTMIAKELSASAI